jgi:cytochrome P450
VKLRFFRRDSRAFTAPDQLRLARFNEGVWTPVMPNGKTV